MFLPAKTLILVWEFILEWNRRVCVSTGQNFDFGLGVYNGME